jgi:hypothetical protein
LSVLELYGCEHAQTAVPPLPVVPDLEVLEYRVGQVDAGLPAPAVEELDTCIRDQKNSIIEFGVDPLRWTP